MIDLHSHLFFDELLGQAGAAGPRIEACAGGHELVTGAYRWPLKDPGILVTTPTARLEALDAAKIDQQVLSLSPLWFFHNSPVEIAAPFLRQANELLAGFCSADPNRLLGMAALPAQDTGAAVAELEYAVRELGLVGAYFGSDARTGLDDPELDELYAACAELDVPLFVHSTVSGTDGPVRDPRLVRWLGQVTLGYPFEETIAAQSLVLGGVLTRHRSLDVLLPHGGGTFPMLHGRVRAWVESSPAAPVDLDEFDASVARLWFDTHVHSHHSLALLRKIASADRLVFGSNFGGWDTGHVEEVVDLQAQLTDNAARLLRRDR
jgi:aminocarboxymuconate-semialdehyde decarboxylase